MCFSSSSYRHQGLGVLSVILANHAVTLLTSLFQDLQVEALHKVRDCTQGVSTAMLASLLGRLP